MPTKLPPYIGAVCLVAVGLSGCSKSDDFSNTGDAPKGAVTAPAGSTAVKIGAPKEATTTAVAPKPQTAP